MFPVTITLQSAAQLNAVMAALALGPVPTAAPAAEVKVEAPKPVKVEKAKPAAVEPTPAPVAEAPTSTASSSAPAPSVDYPTLQKAVFALAGKSRESAAAVAASMGVKTFKELPEAKWADALAAVNAALEAA